MTPAPLPEDFPPSVDEARLAGGDVGEVWRVVLADGRTVVVKRSATDADLEAEGLWALEHAGAPVPRVLAVDDRVLVLEHVAGPGDPEGLGRAIATMHGHVAERCGWHRDNVIGPLRQVNDWTADWASFYAEYRLGPHLSALPAEFARRIQRAIDDGRLAAVLDHGAVPSLLHGDLWSGNIVADRWLIDPAVHHGDRELDLAMLALFGGVPTRVAHGYEEIWPLDDGWERRRAALQLYHLLIHVRLFGAGYLAGVRTRLDQLGW